MPQPDTDTYYDGGLHLRDAEPIADCDECGGDVYGVDGDSGEGATPEKICTGCGEPLCEDCPNHCSDCPEEDHE